jgi:hypothetical protein
LDQVHHKEEAMSDIQRWEPMYDGRMRRRPDGEYVTYADHVAALEEQWMGGYRKAEADWSDVLQAYKVAAARGEV